MRISIPNHSERFGSNLFYSVQKIYELDAGIEENKEFSSPFHIVRQIPLNNLTNIEKDMAIVLPIKDEKLRLLEGVLSGIPNACLPIIISNSQRNPADRFAMECSLLDNFCHSAKKKYVVFHQQSEELASLFLKGEYPHILDENGLVKTGKAEGMIAGILIARLIGKKYIGFVDTDNYFPGSVLEYIRIFSTGFYLAKTPYTMVRINWHSKPKIINNDLFFAKLGRVSRITNHYLNQLLGLLSGFETDIIVTGNAGEHALTMSLALELDYTSGFSIESNHFISMLENFGGILSTPFFDTIQKGVELFQVQSRNPHLHDFTKGEEHLNEMIHSSLSVIYHSQLCPKPLKKEILRELNNLKIIKKQQEPTPAVKYPALYKLDFEKLKNELDWCKHGNFSPI
jgi:mannosyl-3-phosphoglycerate synthase